MTTTSDAVRVGERSGIRADGSSSCGVVAAISPRLQTLIVSLGAIAWFFDGLMSAVVGPLSPAMARSLNLTMVELGPLFSANLVGQAIGLLFISMLPKFFGEKRVLVGCILGFGLLAAVTGFAQSRDQLIALRVLTNIALGGALPIGISLVASTVSTVRVGGAAMMLNTAFGLGAFSAGIIASRFQEPEAWRTCLMIVGLTGAALAIPSMIWLPDVRSSRPGSAAGGASADSGKSGFRALFLSRDLLLGMPLLWIAASCCLMAYAVASNWLPMLLTQSGKDPAFAAFAVSALVGGGVGSGLLIALIIDRLGFARVLVFSLIAGAVTTAALGYSLPFAGESLLLFLSAMSGFFILAGLGGLNAVYTAFFPREILSVGAGWTKFVSRVGSAIAPIAAGFAMQAGLPGSDILYITAVPLVIASVAIGLLGIIVARRS